LFHFSVILFFFLVFSRYNEKKREKITDKIKYRKIKDNQIIKRLSLRPGNIIKLVMPQLLPYYFVNQITFALVALFTITYVMSVYVLPYFVQLFVTRVYITKL
jgi:F-type H+-transporting ATPase subunit 8